MSRAQTGPASDDLDRQLDELADHLYALLPDAFTGARDDDVRRARAEGHAPLARELSRLRKPNQSAWLVNQLWREQSETMEELFGLGDEMIAAQERGSVPELRRLTGRRRELEADLLRRARDLAQRAGVDVSAANEREVQETLSAALAQPEVAAEVRRGRLVKPGSYAGFGPAMAVAPPGERPRSEAGLAHPSRVDGGKTGAARAEERSIQARAGLEAAETELAERTRAAESAEQRYLELREQVEEMRDRLRALETEAAAAQRTFLAEARRRGQAEKEREAAEKRMKNSE